MNSPLCTLFLPSSPTLPPQTYPNLRNSPRFTALPPPPPQPPKERTRSLSPSGKTPPGCSKFKSSAYPFFGACISAYFWVQIQIVPPVNIPIPSQSRTFFRAAARSSGATLRIRRRVRRRSGAPGVRGGARGGRGRLGAGGRAARKRRSDRSRAVAVPPVGLGGC